MLVPLGSSDDWCLLDRSALGDALTVEALPALDPTRSVGTLQFAGGELRLPAAEQILIPDETVRSLALVLAAAESAGLARWCLDTASDYAKVHVQFGRPIGQFQAVKHALADMLVAVEQCAAVAWDAAAAWSELDSDDDDGDDSRHLERAHRGCGRAPGGGPLRQAVHPDPRWHRVHVGARRAPLSQARHVQSAAGGRGRRRCPRSRRRRPRHRRRPAESHGGSARGGRVTPGRRAQCHRRGRCRRHGRSFRVDATRRPGRGGLDHAALAGALGPGRLAPRTARHRRGDGCRGPDAPAPRGRGVGPSDDHRPRQRRAAGALGATHLARPPQLVPALQRAGGRLGPRGAEHEGRRASRVGTS